MALTQSSVVSAHHNYFINGMLIPGFLIGNPDSTLGFYLLGDFLLPGESTPRISCRFFDENGDFLGELIWNRLRHNSTKCVHKATPYGFHISRPSGDLIIATSTKRFPNGYITSIGGRLYDEKGALKLDHEGSSARLGGNDAMILKAPYQGSLDREMKNE